MQSNSVPTRSTSLVPLISSKRWPRKGFRYQGMSAMSRGGTPVPVFARLE